MSAETEQEKPLLPVPDNKENLSLNVGEGEDCEKDGSNESCSRSESPRKVRDIHLDGTTDNMPNVDPYMLDENDLDIQSEAGVEAGSVYSDLSIRSWKSQQLKTPRSSKNKSASSSGLRSSIASRARQVKEFEGAPFLSIDLMPTASSSKMSSRNGKQHTVSRQSQVSFLSASTSQLSQQSPRSSAYRNDNILSARLKGYRLLSAASYASPNARPARTNPNVKSPFKHMSEQPTSRSLGPVLPDQDLKERTALATHAVNKILGEQKPTGVHYIKGRLLKARLKPLEPVQISEPTIHQCRGIVAETTSYEQCNSRTLQRWKAIMSGAQVPRDHSITQDLKDKASTCESVHRTSEASTPDQTMVLLNDLDGLDEEEWTDDELGELKTKDGDTDDPDQAFTLTSVPNSRLAPTHCDDDISNIEGPLFPQSPNVAYEDSRTLPGGDREEPSNNVEKPVENEVFTGSGISPENTGSNELISQQPGKRDCAGKNSRKSISEEETTHTISKRPHSATYVEDYQRVRPPSLRPKTAVDSSRKAVRFADKPNLNPGGRELERARRPQHPDKLAQGKGKSTCKPHSLDSGFDDRDDNDDGRNSRDHTFLTQDQPISSRSQENKNSSSSMTRGGRQKSSSGGRTHSNKSPTKLNFNFSSIGESRVIDAPQFDNESGVVEHSEKAVASSEPSEVNRPTSASLLYQAQPQPVVKARMQTMNTKGRLDERFARYEKKKAEKLKVCVEEKLMNSRTVGTGLTEELSDANIGDESRGDANRGGESRGDENRDDAKKRDENRGDENRGDANRGDAKKRDENRGDAKKRDENRGDANKRDENRGDEKEKKASTDPDRPAVKGRDRGILSSASNSAKPVKVSTGEARRTKALKHLLNKTQPRSEGRRPASSSTYADREIQSEKSYIHRDKDLRPSSTHLFSEKTQILSKHGLLGNKAKNRPNSGSSTRPSSGRSGRPSSHSSTASGERKKEEVVGKQNSLQITDGKHLALSDSGHDLIAFAVEDESDEKLRPKSGTKVKFADENNKDNRKSCLSAKSKSSYLGSPRALLSSDNGDENYFDAELMWRELPDDDSDDEKSDDMEYDSSDILMSKFDLLESELNAAWSELQAEKTKNLPCSSSENLIPIMKHHEAGINSSSTTAVEEEIIVLPDDESVNKDKMMENGGGLHQSKQAFEEETGSLDSNGHQRKREEFLLESCISNSLYKKTHIYVEVAQKVVTSEKTKSKPCQDASASKTSSTKSEDQTEKVKERNKNVSEKECKKENIIVIPTSMVSDVDLHVDQTAKSKQRKPPVARTSRSARREKRLETEAVLTGRSIDGREHGTITPGIKSPNTVRGSKEMTVRRVNSRSPVRGQAGKDTSKAAAKPGHPDTGSSSAGTGNYHDLLLAYRQHCMEDSEKEDENRDKTPAQVLELEKMPLDKKPETAGLENRCSGSETVDEDEEKVTILQRPASIVTDSGVESDGQSLYGEESVAEILSQRESDIREGSQTEHCMMRCDSAFSQTGDVDRQDKENVGPAKVKGLSRSTMKAAENIGIENGKSDLEIVATSKTLMKPRQSIVECEDMEGLSKVPPLCFRLSARPPSGFLYYFAYGPNMNPDRLSSYLGSADKPRRFWALLFGFDLVFNRRGPDMEDASGFPNLEFNPCASTEGCIFQLTPIQLEILDKFMGYPQVQEHVVLPVWMSNCLDSDELGIAQYCVPAVTYIAHTEHTWEEPVKPNEFILDQCVQSSDLVSSAYRSHLSAMTSLSPSAACAITVA